MPEHGAGRPDERGLRVGGSLVVLSGLLAGMQAVFVNVGTSLVCPDVVRPWAWLVWTVIDLVAVLGVILVLSAAPTRPALAHSSPTQQRPPDLAVEVGQSDSGMGRTGLNLALVNRSTHRCRIYGYGGIQLLDVAGAALPSRQLRDGPAPQLITLRPGGRAYSVLTWIFSPEVPPCSSSTFLLVTPPDETKPIRVAFSATVCGNGRISQGAYQTTPT